MSSEQNPWDEFSNLFDKGELENRILGLEEILNQNQGPHTVAMINSLFREIHSLKGSAALLRLEALRDYLHLYEEALGAISRNALKISGLKNRDFLDFFLKGLDLLEQALRIGQQNNEFSWKTQTTLLDSFMHSCGKARVIATHPEHWLVLDELDEDLF